MMDDPEIDRYVAEAYEAFFSRWEKGILRPVRRLFLAGGRRVVQRALKWRDGAG